MRELTRIPGTERQHPCDLLLIAVHPEKGGMLDKLGVETDARGNVVGRCQNHRRQSLCRRRHAPRTVARGMGDQ